MIVIKEEIMAPTKRKRRKNGAVRKFGFRSEERRVGKEC